MSGHSKWASIKHKKGAKDAKRGKLFSKLIRAITVAAREGGGDPKGNAALAHAIDKAKESNMPNENVERAIKRGTGEIEGIQYEKVLYEGFGTEGVAFIVEVLTDNRNRAASDVRNTLTKHGGNMGAQGSVNWMFSRQGFILVPKSIGISEDQVIELAIEGGAEDVTTGDNHFEIVTDPTSLAQVRDYLKNKNIPFDSAEITLVPQTTIKLAKSSAKKILKLVDALQELDDVQEVYANFDIPDQVLEEVAKTI